MADEAENRGSFEVQAGFCDAMAAPITALVSRALGKALDRTSASGRAVLDWPGEPVADAIVLRLIGGFHALHRRGADAALSRVFAGEVTEAEEAQRILAEATRRHDGELLPWLDGPPQTNEAGRSAGLMTGILHLARRFGPAVEVLEIGSSAGMNLLIDRFRFDLGGVAVGPADSPVLIKPEWRGPPPPDAPLAIRSVRGVDIQPLDATDPAQADRLMSYIWVENDARQARMAACIAMIREQPVALSGGDAADWVEAQLLTGQAPGTTRVLMHSVVWQYLPQSGRDRIAAAMAAAGAKATAERRLGWVMMEPNRDLHRHEVRVQGWDGQGEAPMELVALAHAHGTWIQALEPPYATVPYAMRPYAMRPYARP